MNKEHRTVEAHQVEIIFEHRAEIKELRNALRAILPLLPEDVKWKIDDKFNLDVI
jgi:hypothetical protein